MGLGEAEARIPFLFNLQIILAKSMMTNTRGISVSFYTLTRFTKIVIKKIKVRVEG